MNTNIDKINEFIEKTFNSLTTKKESFNIKIKYKDYNLTISLLANNYILFTCKTHSDYYCSSISQKNLYQSFLNKDNEQIDILSIIKLNTLSLKEFLDLNILLICLTESKSDETLFEFFLNKLNEKTMNNEVIKMLFKKREIKQDDKYNNIIDSNINTLDSFNKMYGLNIKESDTNLDLTYTDKNRNSNNPLLKITSKGFLLFCKSKFNKLNKLVLKNNCINDLSVFKNLKTEYIEHLDLSENDIVDFSPFVGLNFVNLKKLILSYNQIKKITCLKDIKLPSLKELDLSHNYIEFLTCLENTSFPYLKSFDLSYNKINSVVAFKKKNFPVLEYLNLNTNEIKTMLPLAKVLNNINILILNQNKFGTLDFLPQCDFKNLTEIYLYSCGISDISYLSRANFPNLKILSLPENNISDISPLQTANFSKLKKLSLYGNKIENISSLQNANFPYLSELYLYQNKISDIGCLDKCKFRYLVTLSLMSNKISDISVFKYSNFNGYLETLALSSNKIKEISAFTYYNTYEFTRLKELWLDHNEINDISSLDRLKMKNVVKIKLGHNFIQNIGVISRMTYFYLLKDIDLNNNVISDISSLTSIRSTSLKTINLSNNSFVVENNTYTLNTLKNRGINVLLQSNDK